jgi:hypothetical protein
VASAAFVAAMAVVVAEEFRLIDHLVDSLVEQSFRLLIIYNLLRKL